MKAFAKVTALCPVISGMSDNGNDWEKQTVVFETLALEPQTLAVEFMGERKTKQTKTLQVGQQVEVNFSIRCNEYQDKWFTRLDGISVRPLQTETPAPAPAPAGVQATMEIPSDNDDLPY